MQADGGQPRTPELAPAEHLGLRRRRAAQVGRGQRLGLEGAGGQAQPVRHRVAAAVEVRRPDLAPEPDLGPAGLGGGQHQPAHPLVIAVQVRPQRDRLQAGPEHRRREHGVEVARPHAEDVERARIAVRRP